MSLEATREFARQLGDAREALLLEREYWSLAIRDRKLRKRYVARQTELREALARGLEARARHLGTPDLPMPAEDVARVVMSIGGGLAVDDLVEPGSVRPELLGEAFALISPDAWPVDTHDGSAMAVAIVTECCVAWWRSARRRRTPRTTRYGVASTAPANAKMAATAATATTRRPIIAKAGASGRMITIPKRTRAGVHSNPYFTVPPPSWCEGYS
jgi:hypothetical protein